MTQRAKMHILGEVLTNAGPPDPTPLPPAEPDDAEYLTTEGLVGGIPSPAEKVQHDAYIGRVLAAAAHLEADIKHREAVCEVRCQQEREFRDNQNGPDLRRLEYLDALLRMLATNYPHYGRKKSKSFTHGDIGSRSIPDKLNVTDHDGVMRWVRANRPEAVEVKETLRKSVLNEYWKAGNTIPGCEVEKSPDEVFVRVREL